MDRDSAELVADPLAFTGVHTRSHFEVELAQRLTDRTRAAHRCSRSFEAGEEPVAGRVELTAAEAVEKLAHARVVLVEHLVPAAVAELTCALGRADDVRKEERRQKPVRRRSSPHAGQELLELREHDSTSPTQKAWSPPASSTKRAPGIARARWRPAAIGKTSPFRCSTSVRA